MRLTTCVLGLALAGLAAFSAHGQAFPTRNVTILVPFAAGGPTDVIMRILGERLSARWGKSVLIENRPGAGTIVATAALARAAVSNAKQGSTLRDGCLLHALGGGDAKERLVTVTEITTKDASVGA